MSNCVIKGCCRGGTHYLKARVWAAGTNGCGLPLTFIIGAQFCELHAKSQEMHPTVFGDDFWRNLDLSLRDGGYAKPDRQSLKVEAKVGDAMAAITANAVEHGKHETHH